MGFPTLLNFSVSYRPKRLQHYEARSLSEGLFALCYATICTDQGELGVTVARSALLAVNCKYQQYQTHVIYGKILIFPLSIILKTPVLWLCIIKYSLSITKYRCESSQWGRKRQTIYYPLWKVHHSSGPLRLKAAAVIPSCWPTNFIPMLGKWVTIHFLLSWVETCCSLPTDSVNMELYRGILSQES